MKNTRKQQARGFALVVVLVIVVAALAAVVAVSDTAVGQRYASASLSREPMARAIAETCADRAASLAKATAPSGDFDDVLDPPGPRQYVPATGTVVQMPAHATDALHSFAVLTKDDGFSTFCDASGACGACLFRYDDNSDDGVTRKTGTDGFDNHGDLEGQSDVDVWSRDRDRAILVTAIGVFPVDNNADLYDVARTRVTVRHFVANAPAAATPGIWVGEDFATDNGKICGVGGITADSMSFANTPCVCGSLNGARSRDPSSCSASDCNPVSCNAQVSGNKNSSQEDPVVTPPETTAPPKWLDGRWLNTYDSDVNGTPADDDVWTLYVRVAQAAHHNSAIGGTYAAPGHSFPVHSGADVDVFVWDTSDTHPGTLSVQCAKNDDVAHPTAALCADDRWNLDEMSCTTYRERGVAHPCTWTTSGTAVCAEGESPCWKPAQSFAFAGDDNGNGPGFQPNKNIAIPQVKDTGLRWNSRSGCTSGNCVGETLFFVRSNGQLKPRSDLTPSKLPQPLMLIHETTATGGVALINNFGMNGSGKSDLIRLSVITTGSFDVPQGAVFAGANCNPGPATPALLKNNASCTSTAAGALSIDNGQCFAVRALQGCTLTNNLGVLGHLRCDTISVNNTGCMVGGLSATGGSVTADPTQACPASGGINILSNPNIIGDITSTGSVCVRNNITVRGDIQTKGSVYLQGAKLEGQIIAEKNVTLKNDTRVSITDPLTFESGDLETAAWLEGTW